ADLVEEADPAVDHGRQEGRADVLHLTGGGDPGGAGDVLRGEFVVPLQDPQGLVQVPGEEVDEGVLAAARGPAQAEVQGAVFLVPAPGGLAPGRLLEAAHEGEVR